MVTAVVYLYLSLKVNRGGINFTENLITQHVMRLLEFI